MLEWKEIKGYNNQKDYNWQEEVELPKLEEEVLIQVLDEIKPNRPPFVGYLKQKSDGHVYIIISANDGMTLYEVKDGVKWARFNRP